MPIARDVEAAPLEVVEPANRPDLAGHARLCARRLRGVDVAPERDVHVAEGHAPPANPHIVAPDDEVVRHAQSHVECDVARSGNGRWRRSSRGAGATRVLRLGRVEAGLQVLEDPIDLEPALVHLDVALDARTQGLACNMQIQIRLQIGKLSAHHAEMVRLRPNVHGPELTFLQDDAARDVQWIAAIVEQAHAIDAHLVAGEHDMGVELVVRGLERIHGEGTVLDGQLAIETRGLHAARDMHVPGERARDVAKRRGQSLDEAQLDGTALHTYVERVRISAVRADRAARPPAPSPARSATRLRSDAAAGPPARRACRSRPWR